MPNLDHLDELLLALVKTDQPAEQKVVASEALTLRRAGSVKFEGQPGDVLARLDKLVSSGHLRRTDEGLRLGQVKEAGQLF